MGRARKLKQRRRWERSAQGQVVARLERFTAWAERRYPHGWRTLDQERRAIADQPWARWCWCPVEASMRIATAEMPRWPLRRPDDDPDDDAIAILAPEVALVRARRYAGYLAALAAWRQAKGVWWFDPDLLGALDDTQLEADIPAEILLRLPEWGP